MSYTLDQLARSRRPGLLLRVASDPPIRLWGGAVSDLEISAGGAETEDAVYQSHGQLVDFPEVASTVNGEFARLEASMSGVEITGPIASLAMEGADAVRGAAVDVGFVLFDDDWQVIEPVLWPWNGTADSVIVKRDGPRDAPRRTIGLSCGNAFAGRRRGNLSFYADNDQRRRSADDAFCDQVAKITEGLTKVWGIQ